MLFLGLISTGSLFIDILYFYDIPNIKIIDFFEGVVSISVPILMDTRSNNEDATSEHTASSK